MPMSPTVADHFQVNGVVVIEWALKPGDVATLSEVFGEHASGRPGARRRTRDETHATASVLAKISDIAAQLQGAPVRLVRMLTFDKTPEANWFVPWHQDRTIAVAARIDAPGFERWTIKDGTNHVEPPIPLLEQMVTLRIHLDACTEDGGALEVLPGSHRNGRLEKAQRARCPTHRRVLHLEYIAGDLPHGLGYQGLGYQGLGCQSLACQSVAFVPLDTSSKLTA
jgi:hypothetical protein